jgi:asparagine synthase (glutamine-hydrolysing)
MLHGLEARSPFLDLEVVDFARRLPHAVKLSAGTTKWILKKALEPLLPGSILYRKKKGFGTPIGPWIREGAITPGIPSGHAGRVVVKALAAHRAGRSDERLFLWCQHVLNAWRSAHSAS